MFSYEQIARWLTFPIDPVTVEDWVANRELFGQDKHDNSEQTEELERAYQVEKLRELGNGGENENLPLFSLLNGTETSGLVDRGDFLLMAPLGRTEEGRKVAEVKVTYLGSKPEKIDITGADVHLVDLDPTRSLKIQINLGANLKINQKSSAAWSGAGKRLLVIDVRGRPLPDFGPGAKHQELMKKMRKTL